MNPNGLLDKVQAAAPNGYDITSYIDAGAQGAVFRGTLNGETVAFKVFKPQIDDNRVDRELTFLKTANHPNLVSVIDSCKISIEGYECFLVAYEYMPGGDLTAFLTQGAIQISEKELHELGLAMGSAIEYLWKSRIVHRDIKPGNIFLDADDIFVLGDFGVARHLDLTALTMGVQVIGTLGYMSPEQARGRKNLTIHSDIFSLGVTMYTLACKQHPYNLKQQLGLYSISDTIDILRTDLQDRLIILIKEMMNVIPANRPTDIVDRIKTF